MPDTSISADKPAMLPAHVWVTSDTGLLKAVNLAKRTATNYYDGTQPTKDDAIKFMTNPTKTSVLTITNSGKVKQFDNGAFETLYDTTLQNPVFLNQNADSIVHAYGSGELFVDSKQIHKVEIKADTDEAKLLNKLHCACALPNSNNLILGGNNVLPTQVDTAAGKETWKAKNVSHNWLDLQVPIWQKDMAASSDTCFYTVTAYGYLRKYDTKAGKRPVLQTSVKELGAVKDLDEIFTCITNVDEHQLAVAGNRGSALVLDARHIPTVKSVQHLKPIAGRNAKSVLHKLKPSDGGNRSISCMPAHGETTNAHQHVRRGSQAAHL